MEIGLLALTVAALVNGLNPCGIGMMITFLGYLLIFGEGKKRPNLWLLGVVYIWAVFAAYLTIGLLFYNLAFYLQRLWLASVFKYLIGGAVGLFGLAQLISAFWPDGPIHLRMGQHGSRLIERMLSRMSLPMAFLVGVAVTAFSTPCMLPLYVGTATVLSSSGLSTLAVLGYFLYYNLIFISPLIVVLVVMAGSKNVVLLKEWSHKYERWIRLVMGAVMLLVGYLIVK